MPRPPGPEVRQDVAGHVVRVRGKRFGLPAPESFQVAAAVQVRRLAAPIAIHILAAVNAYDPAVRKNRWSRCRCRSSR